MSTWLWIVIGLASAGFVGLAWFMWRLALAFDSIELEEELRRRSEITYPEWREQHEGAPINETVSHPGLDPRP